MTTTPKILAFAGSARKQSYNKQLVKIAAQGARTAGADVTYIDLADYPLPIFDEDLEAREGLHPNALKLKELFLAHHGLLIASPEYNSSISALLKNTIDWVSRPREGEAPLGCFTGKVSGIMSASPGMLGGLRGLVHIRAILSNINVMVIPDQLAIAKAHEALNENGQLNDPKQQAGVEGIGKRVAEILYKLYV